MFQTQVIAWLSRQILVLPETAKTIQFLRDRILDKDYATLHLVGRAASRVFLVSFVCKRTRKWDLIALTT